MPAFEAAVKEPHVASLMCAYPRVNGLYNCANAALLNGVIRRGWGFKGSSSPILVLSQRWSGIDHREPPFLYELSSPM
jgi:hypothetical protein